MIYLKRTTAIVAALAILALGYLAGAYIGVPYIENSLLSGNVSKADNANEGVEDQDVLAAMDIVANDTTMQQECLFSLALLSTRVSTMDSLVNATIAATEGVKSLADINKEMKKLRKRTDSAVKSYDVLLAETIKVFDGGRTKAYEKAANNALVSYTVLENSMDACSEMIDVLCEYLEEMDDSKIVKVRDSWMEFRAEDVMLSNSMAALSSKSDFQKLLAKMGRPIPQSLQEHLNTAKGSLMNTFISSSNMLL